MKKINKPKPNKKKQAQQRDGFGIYLPKSKNQSCE